MHNALKGDPSRYRVLGPETDAVPGVIEGVVREKGLHHELYGSMYAVVEAQNGMGYYVPLDKKTEQQIRIGDLVTMEVHLEEWTKKADHVISEIAAQNGGVYRTSDHLKSLGDGTVRLSEGKDVTAHEFVEAHERRLSRLKRLGLVEKLSDGGWAVRSSLLDELRKRDATQPLKKLLIRKQPIRLLDQTTYRGPVWLDQIPRSAEGRAPYGFGAEVAQACEHRDAFVRSLGIDPSSSSRLSAIRSLERADLGECLARENKSSFVPGIPKGSSFRGKVIVLESLPSGQRYAQVVDESRNRFLLLPLTKELRVFEGRDVSIARDELTGKIVARKPGLRRGV